MAEILYCVVQPFEVVGRSGYRLMEPVQAQNRDQALRLARRLAECHGGAIAFSRTGDPDTGEFADAIVLGVFGEVPADAVGVAA